MIIEKKSAHDLETTCERLQQSVKDGGFGVMHVHDIHGTLNSKGVPFEPACRVFEVCNPKRAAEVLATDIRLSNALPCRIAVYQRDADVYVSTITPTSILESLSDDSALKHVAESVEQSMVTMVEQAAAA